MEASIHLQYIGRVPAQPASSIELGDYLTWNGGSRSRVLALVKETPAFLTFKTVTDDGLVWDRRIKKTRLVALTKGH